MKWLWPEEVKLLHWIVHDHKKAFSWVPLKRGCFDEKYFPPVKIPTVPPHSMGVTKYYSSSSNVESSHTDHQGSDAASVYEPSVGNQHM